MSYLRHPLLSGAGVEHGFGVRDLPEPARLWRPKQVHGARAVRATLPVVGGRPEADAVASTVPDLPIGVLTADCVPILLVTHCGGAVAAVHAGWRGLARGVVAAGVGALHEAAPPRSELFAVIGPHIGMCCYEVDEPVISALADAFGASLGGALRPARAGHAWLDLGALARAALCAAGLAPDAVGALNGACTRCDSARFHSYRRDGPRAGRLHHFIAARAAEA